MGDSRWNSSPSTAMTVRHSQHFRTQNVPDTQGTASSSCSMLALEMGTTTGLRAAAARGLFHSNDSEERDKMRALLTGHPRRPRYPRVRRR